MTNEEIEAVLFAIKNTVALATDDWYCHHGVTPDLVIYLGHRQVSACIFHSDYVSIDCNTRTFMGYKVIIVCEDDYIHVTPQQ